jgi:hypothetical protein
VGVTVVEKDFLVHLPVLRRTRDPAFPEISTSGLSAKALFVDGSTNISEHSSPFDSEMSTDQVHLALTSFMNCPFFNPGTNHNLTVPLEPPVSICVGFFFGKLGDTNLITDTPSLPLVDELFKVPMVTRGNGVFDDATLYK